MILKNKNKNKNHHIIIICIVTNYKLLNFFFFFFYQLSLYKAIKSILVTKSNYCMTPTLGHSLILFIYLFSLTILNEKIEPLTS